MQWWVIVLVALFGYFWGNINFSKIILRFFVKKKIDGNLGTANMYRHFGFKMGVLVLILDASKGIIPSVIGLVTLGQQGIFIAGTAAVVGHIFPVFYKFKGGKGVATAIGVYLCSEPVAMVIAFVLTLVMLAFFEYAGAVNIFQIAAMTTWVAYRNMGDYIIVGCILAIFLIIWFAHRKNIVKTITGDEKKTAFRHYFIKKKKPVEVAAPAAAPPSVEIAAAEGVGSDEKVGLKQRTNKQTKLTKK